MLKSDSLLGRSTLSDPAIPCEWSFLVDFISFARAGSGIESGAHVQSGFLREIRASGFEKSAKLSLHA